MEKLRYISPLKPTNIHCLPAILSFDTLRCSLMVGKLQETSALLFNNNLNTKNVCVHYPLITLNTMSAHRIKLCLKLNQSVKRLLGGLQTQNARIFFPG